LSFDFLSSWLAGERLVSRHHGGDNLLRALQSYASALLDRTIGWSVASSSMEAARLV
jgi:hypothetical protein